MKRLSDELEALSDALVRSHATGFTVSAVKLRELAQKARDLELRAEHPVAFVPPGEPIEVVKWPKL